MFAVIFIDAKGPATLGTSFEDKGACRRAWRTCNAGAAIIDAAGEVVDEKSGTSDAALRKLKIYAAHLKRQGRLPQATPSAEPSRGRMTIGRVEIEVTEEDEEEEGEEVDPDDEDEAPETFTRVEGVEQVQAMVARDDARAAEREERWSAPAVAPATGAVVQGDDTERLAPPAAEPPVTCAARGCVAHRGEIRSNTDPALAPLCGPHRKLCHDRARTMGTVAAVAEALVAGTLPSAHEAQVAAGKATAAAKRRAAPAAATCAAKGCDCPPGMKKRTVLPAQLPFCAPHRVVIRQRGRSFPGGEAAVMEHLRAGTLPPVDAKRAALGAKGGRNSRASQSSSRPTRPRKPTPAPAPKPRRPTSPAATLAAGLETARACAEVVSRLGGLGPAREIAALVEEHGGAAAVREALAALAEMGGMAA